MLVKLLEVRDRGTFLPIFAIDTGAANEGQRYLLARCGFPSDSEEIIIARLSGEQPSSADCYFWNDRTMQTAHLYIREHFAELNDGDVIDVEFILGESKQPKTSERNEVYV